MFEKSKFIWRRRDYSEDEYSEFRVTVSRADRASVLNITAGSDYNVFINGKLAFFGQFPDYPWDRKYDSLRLEGLLDREENVIDIVVWYYGTVSAGYYISDAYMAYELLDDNGSVISVSSEKTPSRTPAGYIENLKTNLTPQLGLGWSYDPRLEAGAFAQSAVMNTPDCRWGARPVRKTELLPLVKGELEDTGYFRYSNPDEPRAAELMQRAAFFKDPGEGTDGQYWLVDLGREYVGFPEFEFEAEEECDIMIGWGEHDIDGRCRTATRDYALFYHAVPGKNRLLASFRRLGCRYLQFFVKKNTIKFGYLGIRPVVYPVERTPVPEGLNDNEKRIYDTCVYTLECCMHDHYEDCPWREQALYTLDSRNQMLCGYYAFENGNREFARASLDLISHGRRPDRLLTLTFPTSLDSPIPYYSLAYHIQMDEYIKHTGDTTLAEEVYPVLTDIIDLFGGRVNERGLLYQFPGCWNYYEWEDTLSGQENPMPEEEDAPLAAFFVLALDSMVSISKALKKPYGDYALLRSKVCSAITEHFYDSETKLFHSYSTIFRDRYSVMVNSVCLLCGAADSVDRTNIMEILSHNGAGSLPYDVIPNSLSMNSFRFDALLKADRDRYTPVIRKEIERDYMFMLNSNATTFWETIKGADDMWYGASLCHGWSALPAYYYHTLKL